MIVVSSVSTIIVSILRVVSIVKVYNERKHGIPVLHAHSLQLAKGTIKYDDPRVQLSISKRQIMSLQLAIVATLFVSAPFFILNHILLFDTSSSARANVSVLLSLALTYSLASMKVQRMFMYGEMCTQRDEYAYRAARLDRGSIVSALPSSQKQRVQHMSNSKTVHICSGIATMYVIDVM